jgi:ammonium transporter Rh
LCFSLSSYLAIGTIADKVIRPFGAMIVGSIGGALAIVGFRFIKPLLQKFRVHDTCGVSNLHGLPGLLAGIFGIILAIFPTYSLYRDNLSDTCWHGTYRTYLGQVGYQAATLAVTIGIAVVGGLITGVILRLPLFNDQRPAAYYNDRVHWDVPEDFYQDATTVLLPSQVEHA